VKTRLSFILLIGAFASSFAVTSAQAQQPVCSYFSSLLDSDPKTIEPSTGTIVSETRNYSVRCLDGRPYPPQIYSDQPNSVTATGEIGGQLPSNPLHCNPTWDVVEFIPPTVYPLVQQTWTDTGTDGKAALFFPCKKGTPRPRTTFCPTRGCQHGGCPVIMDLTGQGFFLTDTAHGVKFDIRANGSPIQMGWTAPGADNGFLALPGMDGVIHNGTQLFGNFTPQPPLANRNGFAALAVYDDPANGGNGDGVIDAKDAVFNSLRIWVDSNHDGVSQPEEIRTLPSVGIASISLNYKQSDKVDQFGNAFKYWAPVNPDNPNGSTVGKKAVDVFFVTQ
jgi:hypothetical protein